MNVTCTCFLHMCAVHISYNLNNVQVWHVYHMQHAWQISGLVVHVCIYLVLHVNKLKDTSVPGTYIHVCSRDTHTSTQDTHTILNEDGCILCCSSAKPTLSIQFYFVAKLVKFMFRCLSQSFL